MSVISENDQEIICKDCGQAFIFTERDQKFYKEKDYTPPKRCRSCRAIKKAQRGGS